MIPVPPKSNPDGYNKWGRLVIRGATTKEDRFLQLEPDSQAINARAATLLVRILETKHQDEAVRSQAEAKLEAEYQTFVDSNSNFHEQTAIMSTLVLSISLPFLFTPLTPSEVLIGDDFYGLFMEEDVLPVLNFCFVGFLGSSVFCSLNAISNSFGNYMKLNVAAPDMIGKIWVVRNYLQNLGKVFMILSLVNLNLATLFGVMVTFGDISFVMVVCSLVLILGVTHWITYSMHLVQGLDEYDKFMFWRCREIAKDLEERLEAWKIENLWSERAKEPPVEETK
mmetsp:Transcript_36819/g.57561  ORF Transcript_36819/g.57561 Transcript_36819/m.57561 type:complete len:282 (-) Transcript_36819:89-934(-)